MTIENGSNVFASGICLQLLRSLIAQVCVNLTVQVSCLKLLVYLRAMCMLRSTILFEFCVDFYKTLTFAVFSSS